MIRVFLRTQRIIIDRRIDLDKRDFMEVLVGPSLESADDAALRGFVEKASTTIDLAQEVFDNLESIVRHYDDNEGVSAPAVIARNGLIMAKGRMMNAQKRYGVALDAHSSFLTRELKQRSASERPTTAEMQ